MVHSTNQECTHFVLDRETSAATGNDGILAISTFIGTEDGAHGCLSGERFRTDKNGACLFRSLSHFLPHTTEMGVRKNIMAFLVAHPYFKVKNTPIWQWILWDDKDVAMANREVGVQPSQDRIHAIVTNYAARILAGEWGGAIDLTLGGHLYGFNVHSYEALPDGGFERVAVYPNKTATSTICVLHNQSHYEGFIPRSEVVPIHVLRSQVSYFHVLIGLYTLNRQLK
jgi:hypothetical protein